jgi:hypothetical protein
MRWRKCARRFSFRKQAAGSPPSFRRISPDGCPLVEDESGLLRVSRTTSDRNGRKRSGQPIRARLRPLKCSAIRREKRLERWRPLWADSTFWSSPG